MSEDRFARSAWFRHDRFGMFIHWGPYAVPARGEWLRSHERVPLADYQYAVDGFGAEDFDPHTWAELAAAAGQKYAVLTAKHHDGFCLFDTALTDYGSMHNGIGRDLVAEFLEAFRARGIKVGLYFSLLDWRHPDYPHHGDWAHPERDNPAFASHEPDLESYRAFLHGQVRELCTNYGKLDILWFDFSYEGMGPEQWGAADLVAMVRELQPDVIMDNRLETSGEGMGSIVTDEPTSYCGDFVSPEQVIPVEGFHTPDGTPVPWEACVTLNNNWGYAAADDLWKSPEQVITKLVECVAKGGNLLLNVGPDARGTIQPEAAERLRRIGHWLEANGESVYGAGPAGFGSPEWGYYTRSGSTVYAHVLRAPIGPLPLTGVPKDAIERISLVADGQELKLCEEWVVASYPDIPFVQFGEVGHFTYPLPDPVDTVVRIELKDDSTPVGGTS
ncbi:alpha-L-fucosidase [Streptomyces sp. TLI_105]|uniref:alpha-L-fucosidase n=1 Tax=Streptomyces sp. TLI_105 TaxID=1881019 RepID=UPI00089901DB|nr:alpha-L-fucosidase [Streptomyces sp. TLI_105]SEE10957.1 alpha-L-fucosidase [Streptomyces sp. TLI_105]